MSYFVYILASGRRGTLYVGSTNNLVRRVWEHRQKFLPGFTSKYDVLRLVHFEIFDEYALAAQREKRLKKWKREWKITLIEENNPEWRDLYDEIVAWY
jgi:putative endonuclease